MERVGLLTRPGVEELDELHELQEPEVDAVVWEASVPFDEPAPLTFEKLDVLSFLESDGKASDSVQQPPPPPPPIQLLP